MWRANIVNKATFLEQSLHRQGSVHDILQFESTPTWHRHRCGICELNKVNKVKTKLPGCSQSGRTPLYIAARGSFTAIVDMIIKIARLDYPTPVGGLNVPLRWRKIYGILCFLGLQLLFSRRPETFVLAH